MRGVIYFKNLDKGLVSFLFVLQMNRALHVLYIVYSRQYFCYVGKVKPTEYQCVFFVLKLYL